MLSVLGACEREDKPVKLLPQGSVQRIITEMGPDYDKQVFVNLSTGQTYSSPCNTWELAFECNIKGGLIRTNGGTLIKVVNTMLTDFNIPLIPKKYIFCSDASNGHRDSTAVGCWNDSSTNQSLKFVYLIDRGETKPPSDRYRKFIIEEVSVNGYKIRYAMPDGSNQKSMLIPLSPDVLYSYFTFADQGSVLNGIEPAGMKWDLLFTGYAYIYHEYSPPLSYAVRGALIHPFSGLCGKDSTLGFENITYQNSRNFIYSTYSDAIGYDWKTYSSTSGRYTIRTQVSYILKSHDGYFYKLRFIDFYNNQGLKGYPQFEYQRL